MQIKDAASLGELLQKCRKKAGLTQDQLAMKLNRTQPCISKFEKGDKIPDVFTFVSWMNVTNAHQAAIAFFYGMDGVTILQNIMTLVASTLPLIAV